MSITYFITGVCLFSTLSLVFIWLAERPVNRTKLKVFATLLYVVLVGTSLYFHQSERALSETTTDLKVLESAHNQELLKLREDHEEKLEWQRIEVEREIRAELEAKYAYKENSLNATLIEKTIDLEETIKSQRSEIYALEDKVRVAVSENETLRNELDDLQSAYDNTFEEEPDVVFVEYYDSCEEMTLYYPDSVDSEHEAYSILLDEDMDGVACGPSEQ
ncbi:hypothetical protein [Exiguobacterium sp. AM39-5BH]|uniref:excalibur calcium-binding domain-containing protein n=1 Tax=Exiguobacterium sp. AM39-5BH TaxID=2292355 RepID=UPI000FE22E5A|nr:hypothetical protein [Exiguobacterium sp. AM39-5BH]RHB49598.1 hypothetical protein DW881_07315 [Exiguobacterium sp. AM39-5BH]